MREENRSSFFEKIAVCVISVLLRSIDVERFIDVTLAGKVEAMLANENKPSDRIIDEADMAELFGIWE